MQRKIMNRIKLLPEAVVNKIAAGEVVERPASVVKELLENSIDSGATSIRVIIRGSGRKEIRVEDNGCGMDRDDLILAFERHSTSKLRDFPDLEEITTLGFRGEALPSIAGVSDLVITSRPESRTGAIRLHIFGGIIKDLSEVGAPKGTVVEVKRLFYNTPARKKFLKTDRTELAHITARILEYALANPEIAFYYEKDNEVLFDLPKSASLKERLEDIWGAEKVESLIPIQGREGDAVSVEGFIAPLDLSAVFRKGIYFFINRRPVQDRVLFGAVMEGYGPQLGGRQYITGVIFIKISGRVLDVNIHPTKREVRFSHPQSVRELVAQSIRSALKRSSRERLVYPVASPERGDEVKEYKKTPPYAFPPTSAGLKNLPSLNLERPLLERKVGEETESLAESPPRVLGQTAKRYVLVESSAGLLIIDQHAAHERIIFERFRRELLNNKMEMQTLLTPINLDLDPQKAALLLRHIQVLRELGIEIEQFGNDSFIITSVPAILSAWNREELVLQILVELDNDKAKPTDPREDIIVRMSCLAAVKARSSLASIELSRLVKDLFDCEDPYHCPHGRPTIIINSWNELERRFGRK